MAEETNWQGTRWATEPHIRFGDPCFACGTPMTPASRRWSKFTIPEGYRKHGGNALCSSCAKHPPAGAELGEADAGLLLILLGGIVAVLLGVGVVALTTGVLG